MKHYRAICAFLLLVTIAILVMTFILEYVKGEEPCPLCIIQRIFMMILTLLFIIALLHPPRRCGRIIYNTCFFLTSIAGVLVAARQVYLQTLPLDKIPQCGAGLNYLIQSLPIIEVIKQIFTGTADCALVQWEFIGLSLAAWSLICFSLFGAIDVTLILLEKHH